LRGSTSQEVEAVETTDRKKKVRVLKATKKRSVDSTTIKKEREEIKRGTGIERVKRLFGGD